MSISSGTILKIVVSLLLPDTVIAQNVFYSVVTDLVTSDDEEDVVIDVIDWVEDMYARLATEMVNDITSSDVKVYEYDAIDEDWDEVGADTFSVTFNNTGDMLPHGVAVLTHAKTIDPDVQAGKYLTGFSDPAMLASDLTAGLVTEVADFASAWVTPYTGTATGGLFTNGVWSVVQTNFRHFTLSYSINGQAAYQRRRKPGVGI